MERIFYRKFVKGELCYYEVDKNSQHDLYPNCYTRDRPCKVKHIQSLLIPLNPTVDKSMALEKRFELTVNPDNRFKKVGKNDLILGENLVSKDVYIRKKLNN